MARGRRGSDASTLRLLFFLGQQLARMEKWPPVTLALVAVNVGVYLRPDLLDIVPSVQDACLQPALVLQGWQLSRLLWSGFLHGDDLHVLYNMSSLLLKGSQLEPAMGSPAFAALIAELLILAHAITVLLAATLAAAAPTLAGSYSRACMVGFSAVLFALKVVLSAQSPGWTRVAGFSIPAKYASWAELFYIQLISPRAAFLGHVGGILAGLFHVYVIQNLRIPRLANAHIPWLSQPRPYPGRPQFARSSASNSARMGRPGWHAAMQNAGNDSCPEVPWREGQRPRPGRHPLTPESRAAMLEGDDEDEMPDVPWREGEPQSRPARRARGLRRPCWRQVLSWHWSVALVLLVAILLATNPREEHFAEYMRHYADRGLGKKAGWAVSSLVWLQSRMGISWQYCNLRLFSIARFNSLWFLGILNRWVPLPSGSWLLPLLRYTLRKSVQAWLNRLPVVSLVGVLAALNALLYLATWVLPPRWIVQHCEVAVSNLKRRPWSLLLACFCNRGLLSLAINVQVLLALGPLLQASLGSVQLVFLYLISGVVAHLSAIFWQVSVGGWRRMASSSGASPSIAALLACSAMLLPNQLFSVLPDVRLPALWAVSARLVVEAFARYLRREGLAAMVPDVVASACGAAFALSR